MTIKEILPHTTSLLFEHWPALEKGLEEAFLDHRLIKVDMSFKSEHFGVDTFAIVDIAFTTRSGQNVDFTDIPTTPEKASKIANEITRFNNEGILQKVR